ncbi:MAG: hypothetical protein HY704_06890 [Gemmatimonadetes bacterium]|nr:hypothetical protein [Gemmatimonadota bacterium]
MARSLWLALSILLAGCYRYVPARMGGVPPGTAVRVHLTEEGARRLEELTGRERRQVSGELLGWGEQVLISAAVPAADGMVDRGLRQRIIVARDEVVAVEVRELDRVRTVVLVAGVAAGATAAIVGAFTGGGGEGSRPEPPDGPGEGIRVPVSVRPFP